MGDINQPVIKIIRVNKAPTIFQLKDNIDKKVDKLLSLDLIKEVPSIKNEHQTEERNDPKDTKGGLKCLICNIQSFNSVIDQRAHFKLDWHRWNVNRKLKGLSAVSEAQFEESIEDLSSISGSDSEDEVADRLNSLSIDENEEGSHNFSGIEDHDVAVKAINFRPIIWYSQLDNDKLIGFYRNLIPPPKHNGVSITSHLKFCLKKASQSNWAFIMLGGGHFAAAIFDNSNYDHHNMKPNIVISKTLHRYTVRKKQGGSQSLKDKSSGKSRSVGAQLRRQMEVMMKDEIREILLKWKAMLDNCEKIFVRANSNNFNMLYSSDDIPFTPKDPKVNTFPLTTRRPTKKELIRVYQELIMPKFATLEKDLANSEDSQNKRDSIQENEIELPAGIVKSKEKKNKNKSNKQWNDQVNDDDDEILRLLIEEKIKNKPLPYHEESKINLSGEELDKIDKLVRFLTKKGPSQPDYDSKVFLNILNSTEYLKENINYRLEGVINHPTLLQLACLYNHTQLIQPLLKLNSDPSLKYGKEKQFPYELTKNKNTKLQFRLYRYFNENQFQWDLAKVPSGVSPEENEAKNQQAKEKLKQKKKTKKEQELKRKEEEENLKAILQSQPKVSTTINSKLLSTSNRKAPIGFGSLAERGSNHSSGTSIGFNFNSQTVTPSSNLINSGGYRLGGSTDILNNTGKTLTEADREKRLKAIEERFKKV